MKRTFLIPALLFLAASAMAQTMCAQSKNPVSTALRDILPGRQKDTVAAVEAMPAEKFSYEPSADQTTFGRLVVEPDPGRYLGRPLRRSRNVSAPERCVAADRQEVRAMLPLVKL